MSLDLQKIAEEDFCYLTTIGRISGRPHTIEIWFAFHEQTPSVQMKINSNIFNGTARLITDTQEDAFARKIVFEKYVPRSTDDLVDWSRTSLPIAVDIAE